MRKLATGCLSFGMGIFLAVYLLNEIWLLTIATVAIVTGILCFFIKRQKAVLVRIICLSLTLGLVWSWGYDMLYYRPAQGLDGIETTIMGEVTDYPKEWKYGYKFDVKLIIENRSIKALVYTYGEQGELIPGDLVQITAEFSLTDSIGDDETLSTISKGYMLYGFSDGEISVTSHEDGILHLPKTAAKAVREKIGEIFPNDVAAFLKAMLIGDRAEFSENLTVVNAFSDAGVYHIVAVSGLHVSFFAGMIYMLLGRRKWTVAVIAPLIVLFMAMTGFTPSVTRAGIMQMFVIMAPVFKRDSDSITSLSFALALILMINPYAIAHAGLQLSFLATLGIILVTPKMSKVLIKAAKISKKRDRAFIIRLRDRVLYFVIVSFSTTMGALVLTMPLTAVYFGNISLVAPLANLLILWTASFVFSFGLLVCVLGFIWMPLAAVLAYPITFVVRYILWVAVAIGNSGFAAVYTCNEYIIIWLVYVYLIGVFFVIMKAKLRQLVIPICVSVILLCGVMLITALETDNKPMTFTALDVGQGQSVVMTSGEFTAAIDCGGSYYDAGNILADYILSLGRTKLDTLVLTHYDSDHCNGVDELMERIDLGVLIVPDPKLCDSDMAGEIIGLAESKDIEIIYVYEDISVDFINSELQVYAPLKNGEENEMCLVSLFSCNDFDILVTGDISTPTERILVREKRLPDIEVLVAGHHGSKNSTGTVLLEAVKPETVVISVGTNSYGHPADEVLNRIDAIGAEAYRTDKMGNITITYNGE